MRFRHRVFGELYAQLELGPAVIRQKQADRLERFLLALQPDRDYPFDFLYYTVTGFRPASPSDLLLLGEVATGDLQLLLEALSSSAPRDVTEVREAVHTLQAVADTCRVCVRTVHRWRRRGLVARRYRFPDGRVRIGVRASALALFRRRWPTLVERSAAFARLTPAEQAQVVRMVAELRRGQGLSLSRAVARVAEEVGRSPEGIRQVLMHAEQEGQDSGLLKPASGRMSQRARQSLCAEYRQGTSVAVLAERYGRSRATIYRIVNQERARSALEPAVRWVHSAAFEAPGAEGEFWSAELRELLVGLEATPHLNDAGFEGGMATALFEAYNYAKFALARLREGGDWRRYVPRRLVRDAEELRRRVSRLRGILGRAYMAEVERVVRQHAAGYGDGDLGRAGRECLGECIESYDPGGRASFERYLRLELQKRYARLSQG